MCNCSSEYSRPDDAACSDETLVIKHVFNSSGLWLLFLARHDWLLSYVIELVHK